VKEGMLMLDDDVVDKIRLTALRCGSNYPVANNVHRWFAQRYNAYLGWFFSGSLGFLYNYGAGSEFRAQAVTLLKPNITE